jgi:hypothetical protein
MFKKSVMLFIIFIMAAVSALSVVHVAWAACGLFGDVNNDGKVDIMDIMLVANCWRSTDPECAPYNLDGDGDIDIVDIMLVARNWGQSCGVSSVGMALTTGDPVALTRMRDAGVRWAGTSIAWSGVEPSNVDLTNPANGNWPDGWIQTLVQTYGFTPAVLIWKNPSWAASTTCGPIDCTPLTEFAQFVRALTARYDGDGDYNNDGVSDGPLLPEVLYFTLYNEADFDLINNNGEADYGGCWGQAPTDYAEMVHMAYLAMKSGNPRVQVLFGGIAYDRFTAQSKPGWYPGPTGPFDYNFTRNVLSYLYTTYPGDPNLPFFDIMSFHNYNDFRDAWDGTMPNDQELLGKIKHIKDNQLYVSGLYDLRDMPFVCSEIGVASAPTDTWTERNEAYQSDYVAQAYGQGMAAGLVANFWFPLADYTQFGRCNQIYDWLMGGVLCSASVDQASDACSPNPLPDYSCPVDFGPKPAYEAIEALNVEMAGVTYDGQLTGSSDIVAFRFNKAEGGKKIVAWTDTGERIGKKGVSPLAINMDFNASHFGGEWTGQLRVVDKLGNASILSGGSSITVQISQSPRYIEVYYP